MSQGLLFFTVTLDSCVVTSHARIPATNSPKSLVPGKMFLCSCPHVPPFDRPLGFLPSIFQGAQSSRANALCLCTVN